MGWRVLTYLRRRAYPLWEGEGNAAQIGLMLLFRSHKYSRGAQQFFRFSYCLVFAFERPRRTVFRSYWQQAQGMSSGWQQSQPKPVHMVRGTIALDLSPEGRARWAMEAAKQSKVRRDARQQVQGTSSGRNIPEVCARSRSRSKNQARARHAHENRPWHSQGMRVGPPGGGPECAPGLHTWRNKLEKCRKERRKEERALEDLLDPEGEAGRQAVRDAVRRHNDQLWKSRREASVRPRRELRQM